MEYGCRNKTVVITGGTSGIGLAAARAFWLDGANVNILGHDRTKGMEALAQIIGCVNREDFVFPGAKGEREKTGVCEGSVLNYCKNASVNSLSLHERNCSVTPEMLRRLRFIHVDVTKQASCRMAAVIAAHYGEERIDILVNSAGVYQEKRLEQVSLADYNRIMDVNVKGTLLMTQACQPYMLPHGENEAEQGQENEKTVEFAAKKAKADDSNGHTVRDRCIINISSDAGIGGNYGCPVYCASKGAVVSLSKALALDMAPDIRVNCICPGDVDTPMLESQLKAAGGSYTKEEMGEGYPLGRIATAKEVAHVICSAASPANSFMTGAVIPVDGGLTAIG